MANIDDLETYFLLNPLHRDSFIRIRQQLNDEIIKNFIVGKSVSDLTKLIKSNPDEFIRQASINYNNFQSSKNRNKDSKIKFVPLLYIGWGFFGFILLAQWDFGYRINLSELITVSAIYISGFLLILILSLFRSSVIRTPIKNKASDFITNIQRKELQNFITLLENADDEEVGLALAISVNFANLYRTNTGIDLFDPAVALIQKPDLTLEITRTIEEAQDKGNPLISSQLMVWAHTLRSINNPQLRGLGRDLWGILLSRGVDHAYDASESIVALTGSVPDLSRLGEAPAGLAPRNDNTFSTTKENSKSKSSNIEEKLNELKELHSKGLISEQVFKERQLEILRD